MNHDTEKQEIEKLLTDEGFVKHSGDLHNVGKAIKVIFPPGCIIPWKVYERKAKLINEFLGC